MGDKELVKKKTSRRPEASKYQNMSAPRYRRPLENVQEGIAHRQKSPEMEKTQVKTKREEDVSSFPTHRPVGNRNPFKEMWSTLY